MEDRAPISLERIGSIEPLLKPSSSIDPYYPPVNTIDFGILTLYIPIILR